MGAPPHTISKIFSKYPYFLKFFLEIFAPFPLYTTYTLYMHGHLELKVRGKRRSKYAKKYAKKHYKV
ncbi:MAG: hypothetical protein DRG39_04055 [Deltaproteobacteria bacterium]|nr:MAG: hypothetical protein DRG39_04055 [Deltaproteobacteria bacterium]